MQSMEMATEIELNLGGLGSLLLNKVGVLSGYCSYI